MIDLEEMTAQEFISEMVYQVLEGSSPMLQIEIKGEEHYLVFDIISKVMLEYFQQENETIH